MREDVLGKIAWAQSLAAQPAKVFDFAYAPSPRNLSQPRLLKRIREQVGHFLREVRLTALSLVPNWVEIDEPRLEKRSRDCLQRFADPLAQDYLVVQRPEYVRYCTLVVDWRDEYG